VLYTDWPGLNKKIPLNKKGRSALEPFSQVLSLILAIDVVQVSSYDTVGNAYFGLTIHALPAGWRRVAVVTSAFHMHRTAALFTTMWPLAARDLASDPGRFQQLVFVSASDEGLWPEDVLEARAAKEVEAAATWRRNFAGFATFSDLHTWFYATHQCYAVPRQHEAHAKTITNPKLLASY
jgi:hypothetical protein